MFCTGATGTVTAVTFRPYSTLTGSRYLAAVYLRLDHRIQSKSNYRWASQTHEAARWTHLRDFERDMSMLLQQARPAEWILPSPAVALPDRPMVVSCIIAATMLDAGNVTKSIHDTCQGVLVVNDAEICSETVHVLRRKNTQHAIVGYAQLPAQSTVRARAGALSELSEQLLDIWDDQQVSTATSPNLLH